MLTPADLIDYAGMKLIHALNIAGVLTKSTQSLSTGASCKPASGKRNGHTNQDRCANSGDPD